jgi:hypothetical protein
MDNERVNEDSYARSIRRNSLEMPYHNNVDMINGRGRRNMALGKGRFIVLPLSSIVAASAFPGDSSFREI